MRVRRLLVVLTVVAASALVVPSAAAAQARYEPRFESAPCPPDTVSAAGARECALRLPRRPGEPQSAGGRKIHLAVAIVPAVAQQPAPDPLVNLTGGPGGVAILLSGSFDAVTPLAWSYAAAETLTNSWIASIPGVGHFVAPESPCAQSIVASFLLRPDAPDTNCVATLRPPSFVTP